MLPISLTVAFTLAQIHPIYYLPTWTWSALSALILKTMNKTTQDQNNPNTLNTTIVETTLSFAYYGSNIF